MEVVGNMTAICERHPETGEFTVPIHLSFRNRKKIDCPRCGRGYPLIETYEDEDLIGGKVGDWYCDRKLTVIRALFIGHRYEITYRNSMQQLFRVGVMDYLDEDDESYILNARPIAGTQTMPKRWVKSFKEVPKDTRIEIGRVIR